MTGSMPPSEQYHSGRYEVLLLDFGGVCLLNPVELHARAERALDLAPGALNWMGPVAPETDELWREMIAGNGLTERDYWHRRAADVGRLAGVDLDLRQYMTLLYEPPGPELVRPGAERLLAQAKAAGIGVSVLTNDMRAFHGRDWEQGIDFLRSVDHIVDCSDTNILKPDPRAFQRALDIVGADAHRVLFVDDQPLNVEGAAAAGMDALWFDIANTGPAWTEVARRLGLPVGEGEGAS